MNKIVTYEELCARLARAGVHPLDQPLIGILAQVSGGYDVDTAERVLRNRGITVKLEGE